MVEQPGAEPPNRRLQEQRKNVEFGAQLAIEVVAVREYCDHAGQFATAMWRQLELLRTPTAPPVQAETALTELRSILDGLKAAEDRLARAVRRVEGLLERGCE